MREMQKGDFAFFYHSNCKTPGIVGAMEIVQEHSTDGSNNFGQYHARDISLTSCRISF